MLKWQQQKQQAASSERWLGNTLLYAYKDKAANAELSIYKHVCIYICYVRMYVCMNVCMYK